MKTFLDQAAEYIFEKYRNDLHQLVIILPTKRSSLVFKKSLSLQASEPVWSPQITTIDDFITEYTDLELIDPIELLWDLFLVFRNIEPELEFDKFSSWAYTLLSDFEKIDQNMVNPKAIFDYMSQTESIKRWQNENIEIKSTAVTEKHFLFWTKLFQVYTDLKIKLFEKRKAYRGMVYRALAENTNQLTNVINEKKYVFIGLNFLTKSEEKIIQFLISKDKAEMIWDTDEYYMEFNKDSKAGENLRKYKKNNTYGSGWNWEFNNFKEDEKQIHVLGLGNASIQGKVAAQINQSFLNSTNAKASSVVVLPDENLLLSLLNNLDEGAHDFNITMGLSLRNSSLFSFINYLFDLQYLTLEDKINNDGKILKFNGRNIIKILTHPLIKMYEQSIFSNKEGADVVNNFIQNTLQQLNGSHGVFFTPYQLFDFSEKAPLFKILFTPWYSKASNSLKCFSNLIEVFREIHKTSNHPIENESLFLFETFLNRLDNIFSIQEKQGETFSLRSLRLFINELFRQSKLPFTSQQSAGLQIMGMLETRALDFENVIILSCNEGSLPQIRKQNSLIPFDANLEFGLPTYQVNENGIAYNFYRLIQRAKNIYLLYVLPSDTYGGNEKSRFLHQIENELIKYNPNIKIYYHSVEEHEEESLASPIIRFEKNPYILGKIKEVLTNGISPSQLNNFVECSLKYYFNSIVKIREDKETEETMGIDKFGEMVHKTLEEIDIELQKEGKTIFAKDLENIIPEINERVKTVFSKEFPEFSIENGLNYLYYKVAGKMIENLLHYQINNETFPIKILRLEKKLDAGFLAEIENENIEVKITGRIDRIDQTNENEIRIIDYKTGKVSAKDLTLNKGNEESLLNDPDKGKIRQLWLYKYIIAKGLLSKQGENNSFTLSSGIYSLRNIEAGYIKENIRFETGESENLETFIKESERLLTILVNKILDPNAAFEQTEKISSCRYCSYTKICKRDVEDFN